jgi:hypothetical protein
VEGHTAQARCTDESQHHPSSSTVEALSAPPQSFNPISMFRLDGRPVVHCPGQLRLHQALRKIGWTGVIDDFNDAARLKNQCMNEPILVTPNGTILAGFGRWQLAMVEGRREIHCIEYALGEDESIRFILFYHQSKRGWNAFVRIRLALTQEPVLQQAALDNMRSGGKYKGWASLPDVHHINVRQQIATAAGVGCRNVSNVKTILQVANPRLIEALTEGAVTINRAIQFCKLPRPQQLEQFMRYSMECATNKVIRRAVTQPRDGKTRTDLVTVLDALRQQEVRQPGSVEIRVARHKQSVVVIGRDLLGEFSREELKLT